MAAHTGPGLTGNTLSVTGTAAEVAGKTSYHRTLVIQNIDSADPVYIGGSSGLTTSNGYRIAAGEAFSVDLPPFTEVYVIGSSEEIRYLLFDGIR
jgi:hypothetical protein